MYVQIIVSSVELTEWPPFGKELLTLINVCSLYVLCLFAILVIFDL